MQNKNYTPKSLFMENLIFEEKINKKTVKTLKQKGKIQTFG